MFNRRSPRSGRLGRTLLGACILSGGLAASVGAPTPVVAASPESLAVTSMNDDGPGSLRAAVQAANADAAPDEIVLGQGIYTLDIPGPFEEVNASGDLDILQPLTIRGQGQHETTINASLLNDRVLHVLGAGQLTLIDVAIVGGGSSAYGGGVLDISGNMLTVTDSAFRHNFAAGGGGAITALGPFMITGSTFSTNQTTGASSAGGAIYFSVPGNGTFGSIDSSAFVDNIAADRGGAIIGNGVALQIRNSTFSGNEATQGSALFNMGGVVASRIWRLEHTTIAYNESSVATGAVYTTGNGEFTLADSIVAENEGGACNAAANAEGLNIVPNNSCGVAAGHFLNLLGADPGLQPLDVDDRPTPTHRLNFDSLAVNATTCGADELDQRGTPRPTAPAMCDIGAYERRLVAVDDPVTEVVGQLTGYVGVLYNDIGLDWPLTPDVFAGGSFTLATQPVHGTATIVGTTIHYQSDLGYSGPDAFVYELCLAGECSTASATVEVKGGNLAQFEPLPPQRILDTRTGAKPTAGSTTTLQVTGVGGVPADGVTAVVLNITATQADAGGYVTVYPSGQPQPTVSSLNVEFADQSIPNLVTVPVGTNGSIELFTYAGLHLIADVAGYYRPATTYKGGRFIPVEPARLLDTRADGSGLVADATRDLAVTGVGGVPADASAVVLNVTATRSLAPGYVTVWPAGLARPDASNLNVSRADQTIANLVIVPVGADNRISLYSDRGTDLVVDVTGWYTGAGAPDVFEGLFMPVAPTRILDTRPDAALQADESRSLVVADPGISATAVVLNVTATQATGAGYLTVSPSKIARPLASNLNVERADQTIPNAVIVGIGDSQAVDIYSYAGTHLAVDVAGYFVTVATSL